MNAEEYLKVALGGNMNISTLKPLAWHEIMTDFAKHYHKELSKSVLPDVSECGECGRDLNKHGKCDSQLCKNYDWHW